MSTRFKNPQADTAPIDDGETVAALVRMLSGMGIERSRIDAMISKTTRPSAEVRSPFKSDVANDSSEKTGTRRSA